MRNAFVLGLIGALTMVSAAAAQTGPATSTSTISTTVTTSVRTDTRPLATLSPGDQTIASALFAAQDGTSARGTVLSVDDIASLRLTGRGWNEIFHQMKLDGTVTARSLGQVVSSYERQHPTPPEATVVRGTSTSDERTVRDDRPAHGILADRDAVRAFMDGGAIPDGFGRGRGPSGSRGRR